MRCLTLVYLCLRFLPFPYSVSRFIEEALIISFVNLLVCFFVQQLPQCLVLVIDTQISLLLRRCHFICAEQEAVGVTVDQVGRNLYSFQCCDQVLRDFIPRNIEIDVTELWIFQNGLEGRNVMCEGERHGPDPCAPKSPFTDAYIAMAYRSLSKEEQARSNNLLSLGSR